METIVHRLRAAESRLGLVVALALTAAVAAPLTGVQVHHHLGGGHHHVHREHVSPHGHHHHDVRGHVHQGTGTGAVEHGHDDRGAIPAEHDRTFVAASVAAEHDRTFVAAPAVVGHLHAFDPFLHAARAPGVGLVVVLTDAAIDLPSVIEPRWRSPVAVAARGPPRRAAI